jgi:hypothetical protein
MLRFSAATRSKEVFMKLLSSQVIPGLSIGLLSFCVAAGAQAQESAQPTNEQLAERIDSLLNQVHELKQRLEQQATTPHPSPAQTSTAGAASWPNSIHYKGLNITLGGFLAAESIFRQHDQANDISTSFAAIPYANSSVGHTQELRFTARQSRVSALVQGNVSPSTQLGFYSEFDFQGGAQTANSNETNSYNPRLRHMYGSVDWDALGLHLLAGQSWSLVTLNSQGITPRNEAPPPTIDGQYIPGFTWTRQPQIRLTKNFDKALWVAVSVENPQTTFYTGANPLPSTDRLTFNTPAGQGFDTANTLSLNHIPDVVGKAAYEATIADRNFHLEAYYLYRSFYERLNLHNQNSNGGGFGGGFTMQVVPQLLDFQVSALAGKGIGRYGSAQLTDATLDPAGNIHPIHEVEALAGLTLHLINKLDYYVFYGEEKESAEPFNLQVNGGGIVPYGYGNTLYQNGGCFSEVPTVPAIPCVGNTRLIRQATTGFWFKAYTGSFGRLQYGLQYSYSQRRSFAGLGGTAIGNQNIVLASLRYYPF